VNVRLAFAAPLAFATVLAACSSDSSAPTGLAAVPAETQKAAIATYATHVKTNYDAVDTGAAKLQQAITAFLAAPSAAGLEAAKKAWVEVRPLYGESEGYRFYAGPIDSDDGPEGRLNSWPIDENFIDGVKDNPTSGLINDTTFEITEASIAAKNEDGGEKNISCGWHAIEFLLWGQDFSVTGPGNRPYTDFLDDGPDATMKNGARRRKYLEVVTALLVADLKSVSVQWDLTKADTYGAKFVADVPVTTLSKMLKGIGALAAVELPNERMNNAYSRKEQEEEHSCFSDTTINDLVANATSVENIWLGRFGNDDKTGLDDLVRVVDPTLADKTTKDVAAIVAATKAIPYPFDQAIFDDANGRPKIKAAIESCGVAKADLEAVAAKLGLTINFNDN
jgi:putative iron-regulated protein